MNIISELFQSKKSKIIATALLIAFSSLLFSSTQTNATLSYIDTDIHTENDATFKINGVIGKHTSISASDVIETTGTPVSFILNQISSVEVLPYSQITFLKLGDTPIIEVFDGSVQAQTMNELTVLSDKNSLEVKQGGVKVTRTKNSTAMGNFYGSSTISIHDQRNRFLLSYALPIQKQVNIYKDSNKTNWSKIRYSKLNKELRLAPFTDVVLRENFLPNLETISNTGESASFAKKLLTLNPKKKEALEVLEFNSLFQDLSTAIENKSAGQVKTIFPEFESLKNLPQIHSLPKLIAYIKDPFVRYTYEKELNNLLGMKNQSLSSEIKYFYTLWNNNNEKQLADFYKEVENKITAHKNNLAFLEEDYNLLTALIEAYPHFVDSKTLELKRNIENSIFTLVKTDTEKTDLILSSYEKDLNIIALLIENDNGTKAKNLYEGMLINTTSYQNDIIPEYRTQYADLEENIKILLAFQAEYLHSAAFNEEVYNKYKQGKLEEKDAVTLFQDNVVKLRLRPSSQNFGSIVETLKNHSINVNEKNISYLFTGGKLLFIQEARLDLYQDNTTFNFIFDPETQTVSDVTWQNGENTSVLPPLEDNIPLEKFQEAYNELLLMKTETQPEVTEKPIADWASLSENSGDYDMENAIKKRLTQEKLALYQITSQEKNMKQYGNTMNVNNATTRYVKDEKEEIVTFNIRLDLTTWNVLSIQIQSAPNLKLRTSVLKDVVKAVVDGYEQEKEKMGVQEIALSAFQNLSPDVSNESFQVDSTYKNLVHFENISIRYKGKDYEEIWKASGSYNTDTKILPMVTLSKDGKTIQERNLAISQLKTRIGQTAPQKKLETVNSTADAEEVIKKTTETLSEQEMQEVKDALDNDKSWF